MNDNNNMTCSEKLNCFVDGELPPEESGDLFYELAGSPELQEELRQLIAIKNTLKNSILTAPLDLKADVLKRTVYKETNYQKLANAVALLVSFFMTKSSLTYIGGSVVALIAFGLISDSHNIDTLKNKDQSYNTNVTNPIYKNNIPEVNSKEIRDEHLLIDNQSINNHKNNILSQNNDVNVLNSRERSKLFAASKDDDVKPVKNTEEQQYNSMNKEDNNKLINVIDFSNPYKNIYFNNEFPTKKNTAIMFNNAYSRLLNNFSFSLKKFDGTSYPNLDLNNSNETIFNNISIGLNYNLDHNQSIGLAVGFENYQMSFDKIENDILYNYQQSYNAQWLAVQYNYTMDMLGESGLRPNFNSVLGTTNIGPIVKLGAGLTYVANDYFAVTAGLEAGWLFYTNNGTMSNSKWFTTNKLSYNIGFNIGL